MGMNRKCLILLHANILARSECDVERHNVSQNGKRGVTWRGGVAYDAAHLDGGLISPALPNSRDTSGSTLPDAHG